MSPKIPRNSEARDCRLDWHRTRLVLCVMLLVSCVDGCGPSASPATGTAKSNVDRLERTSEKGPVKLTVQVTPAQPRLSDQVEMDVQVTAAPEVEVKPPTFGQAVGDFLVRDYSERKDASSDPQPGQPVTHRYRYQLEPVAAGRHLIRSLAIEFIDRRKDSESRGKPLLIESEPLEVEVTSEFGNKVPDLADVDPMLPPRPISGSSLWPWIVGSMLIASALIATVLLARRRKIQSDQPRILTPEEIAHAALSQLLEEKLPEKGLVKEFYLRLTGIVRQFIEGTTGLKAPEQTTEEFLRAMRTRDVFPVEQSLRLKEFLEAADMVKYAGQQPDHDQIELSIARAREFIGLRTITDNLSGDADIASSKEEN